MAGICLVSGDISRQFSRVIDFMSQKEVAGSAASQEGGGIEIFKRSYLPIPWNEIGNLSISLNLLAMKLEEEKEKNIQARKKIEELNEEKTNFLSVMSNELKNPINRILGISQNLVDGFGGELSEAQRENIRIINQSGKNLLSLINDILDLSELETGRIKNFR